MVTPEARARSVIDSYLSLTRDEKRHLKEGAFRGWELVKATARVCAL